MNDLLAPTPTHADAQDDGPGAAPKSAFSKTMEDAGTLGFSVIDRQIDRLAGAIEGAAETVHSIVGQADPLVQDNVNGLIGPATDRLRTLADTVRAQDGRALAGKAQQAIAQNSAVAIGIGAVIGALAIGLIARTAPAR